jgi:hypothetical protein
LLRIRLGRHRSLRSNCSSELILMKVDYKTG